MLKMAKIIMTKMRVRIRRMEHKKHMSHKKCSRSFQQTDQATLLKIKQSINLTPVMGYKKSKTPNKPRTNTTSL